MFFVAFIAFSMFNYVGDPIHQMVGQDTSFEQREKLREQLGLNDPAPVQFLRFVGNALQGEFGLSYQHKRPVAQLIAERLPATLELAIVAAIISLGVGVPLGVYTGLHRSGWLSRLAMTFSLIGVSLPTFLVGIILIYIFAVILGWLPSFGRGEVVQVGFWSTGLLTAKGLRPSSCPPIPWACSR